MIEISVKNASKSFARVPALQGVNLTLRGGEVHALMGENGAGKSTLIKVLAGVIAADRLDLEIDKEATPLASTADAKKAGFQFIHQELNIAPNLSVAENISLGFPYPKRFGFLVDWSILEKRALLALSQLGVEHIDVNVQAARLSTGDQMLMRIAGSLVQDTEHAASSLYVFDEPTAAMSDEETERLFSVIASLKQAGKAVLYVSHRMNEVMRIADRVSVLRDGKLVSSKPVAETSQKDIIIAMTGRDLSHAHPAKMDSAQHDMVCIAQNVATKTIRNVNFELRQGEILGVTGLANAGQSDVLKAVFGLQNIASGSLSMNGHSPQSAAMAWQNHLAYVPKERRTEALMLKRSIRDNIALAQLPALSTRTGIISRRDENKTCLELAEAVGLKYQSLDQPVYQLSGGNQQKVVFARAISVAPKMLLLDEPTRGVDVGAKFEIYSLLRKLTAQGCSILLTSTDLPELLGMCDRILIMQDGAQSEIVDAHGLQASELLQKFYTSNVETRQAL